MSAYVLKTCFRSTDRLAGSLVKSNSRLRTGRPRSTPNSRAFRSVALLLIAFATVIVAGTASGQLPGFIDLNVTPGTESSPVLKPTLPRARWMPPRRLSKKCVTGLSP